MKNKMEKLKQLHWYEFTQNNSGGSFDVSDTTCHRMFIEAYNSDQATSKAEDLGCYWNGVEEGNDCECCGDRWSPAGDALIFPYNYGSFTDIEKERMLTKYPNLKFVPTILTSSSEFANSKSFFTY